MTSPIPADGVLCKSNTPWPEPVAKWTAGQSITVEFEGSAVHDGGHCQFSLSYDGGKTFAVVYELIRYCFVGGEGVPGGRTNSYTFDLPKNIPSSDKVVFAWSWVNNVGNREFYMNCADVTISGGSSSSYTGKQMVIANHNGYPTIQPFGNPDDYAKGYALYKNAPEVTVGPNGSSGGSDGSSGADGSEDNTPSDSGSGDDETSVPPYMPGYFIELPDQPDSESDTDSSDSSSDSSGSSSDSDSDTIDTGDAGNTDYSADTTNPGDSLDSSPPDSVPTGGGGECTHGAMECSAGGSGFRTCLWGKWDAERPCGPGTKCQSNEGGGIFCGWP
ncbi:hypothetical protein H4R20_002204 [Coemansia guatemalensis]|uniref:Chitin-binding type-4 domain-containing protein n=1 Tax=Coemansia guatemalensis TaxID=2761395 RepID=A0A9W8I2X9_9FUNG|nr:hypothetical protein H4R20_002204 [Coemansia guatemalensis]